MFASAGGHSVVCLKVAQISVTRLLVVTAVTECSVICSNYMVYLRIMFVDHSEHPTLVCNDCCVFQIYCCGCIHGLVLFCFVLFCFVLFCMIVYYIK